MRQKVKKTPQKQGQDREWDLVRRLRRGVEKAIKRLQRLAGPDRDVRLLVKALDPKGVVRHVPCSGSLWYTPRCDLTLQDGFGRLLHVESKTSRKQMPRAGIVREVFEDAELLFIGVNEDQRHEWVLLPFEQFLDLYVDALVHRTQEGLTDGGD